ncbi:MAG: GNAT family N-acetyltransferase [Acidimicrobiia bacterium]
MPGELLARVFETVLGYLALGNEVIDGPLGCFVRNPDAPNVYDANHGTRVRASTPKEINTVLERSDELLSASRHRQFIIDGATPPTFEARLALDGYERRDELAMLLEGDLAGGSAPRGVTIRPVESDADWASLQDLFRMDHVEEAQEGREPISDETTRQVVATKRYKAPALAFWLASVKRTDCAFFSAWPGTNGVGKVEDLFTHPDYRHRGIATALIRHSVDDARARGAKGVNISARIDDTPKDMYAAMGFRPLCVIRSWLKTG